MRKLTILKLIIILLLIIAGNTIYLFTKSKVLVEINQKIEQDIGLINQPEEVLKKLDEQLNKNQSMHCIISMKVNGALQTKTEVFIKKPKQVLLRYLHPNNGVTIAMNNKDMWIHFGGDNTLHAVSMDELKDMPENILPNVNLKLTEYIQKYKMVAETGANENEIILSMYPKKDQKEDSQADAKITLKINKNNWTIISEEHEKYDGSTVTMEYSDMNYSPLNDSVFEPPKEAVRYNDPEIFYEFLIELYTQANQYEIANYFTDKALKIAKDDAGKRHYSYVKASICIKMGKFEEALKYYKEVEKYPLSEVSKDSITYFKGLTLWNLKRCEEAIAEFEKLSQKPSTRHYIDSLIAIGRIYYEGFGNKEKAMQYLEKALNEAPAERKAEIQNLITIYKNF